MRVSKLLAAAAIAAMVAPVPALSQGNSGKGGNGNGQAVSAVAKDSTLKGRAKAYAIICLTMKKEGAQCDNLLAAFQEAMAGEGSDSSGGDGTEGAGPYETFSLLCTEFLFGQEDCDALFGAIFPNGIDQGE